MKTIEQLEFYESKTLDGRDISRLTDFMTESQMQKFGISLKEEYRGRWTPENMTREIILERLKQDVAFGFEKALNHRGLSAGMMFSVVMMWNWILEEGLEDYNEDDYAQYGLPLFKATAIKYGFDNPIGEDSGSEDKYASY